MYRHRIHLTVQDVKGWNEALAVTQEMNAMAERLGEPSATVWTETVGVFNQLVVEIDYDSLAAFETGQNKMSADPEWPTLVGRLGSVLVEGKGYTELMERASPLGGPTSARE